MMRREDRFELPLRLLAAAIIVTALGLLNSLSGAEPHPTRSTTVFLLVFAVCSSFMLIARGLGVGVAAGLGVVIAVSISMALASFSGAVVLGHAAFTLASTSVLVLIGRIAGASDREPSASEVGRRRLARSGRGFQPEPQQHVWGRNTQPEPTIERTLGGLVSDFCVWTGTDVVRAADDGAPVWPAFARFVRQALRDRLGVGDVEIFEVSEEPARVRPLAPRADRSRALESADSGPFGCAIRTQQVYSAPRHRAAGVPTDDAQHWQWVLPLCERGHARALVAIADIERSEYDRPSVAHAVRDLLQLCWVHVRGMQALRTARRTDTQTGLLTRTELLAALRETSGDHRDEPVAVLVLTLEGLRRLDDAGQWAERDELVSRLGQSLRKYLCADDLLARFSDDRFVVAMRRTTAVLGQATARRLLEHVREEVLERVDPEGSLHVGLRAGMSGTGLEWAEPEGLLSKALNLLDKARAQACELACDADEHGALDTMASSSQGN